MPVEKTPPERRLYWSKAKRSQLLGFVPEKKNAQGDIVQGALPIHFQEHIYATENPKEIAFIENSNAFKRGRIKFCADEKEAAIFTEAHDKVRAGVVVVKNEMDRDVYSRVG